MKALLTAKVGMFLVVSSVLAIWTLLVAQHVQAHSLTNPSCSRPPTAQNFFTGTETAALSNGTAMDTATPKKGTGESGEGNENYYYAKITVPALTAGELMVSDSTTPSTTYSSEGILCGRQEGSVTSLPSYTSAHTAAERAATTAEKDEMDADTIAADTAGTATETSIKRALRAAANDLERAANALAIFNSNGDLTGGVAKAAVDAAATAATDDAANALATFDNNGDLTAGVAKAAVDAAVDADTAADDADTAADDADTNTGDDEVTLKTDLGAAADDLGIAANALRVAAHALDPHMGFSINTLISSGDEEYVVVMTALEGGTPSVSVDFSGVMSTDAAADDGGSFTQNNQRDTHTLRATNPGLLTVETTGSAVDTIGTLDDANLADDSIVAMDEGSGGNFEIVSPMDDAVNYTVYVEGQTRGERGDYGLKVAFRVAEDLTDSPPNYANTTREDEQLERGRADYFFFTTTTDLFLTVETEKHADVTTETNTIGTLFSPDGLVTTDTNSGTGNNFLLRTPIASGKDYIIGVKGSSSSTEGQYVLVTSAENAPSQGSAPDGIVTSTDNTAITNAGEVDPHSITVTKAGTLQVKTTGTTDTVGVLYGPDGRQIATDDNSADGMKNFLITEHVEAGQYIVTVEGQSRTTTEAAYTLVVNFVESVVVGTTNQVAELERERDTALAERNTARTERDTARAQVTRLEDQVAPVEVDETGYLGNPSGVRSGIGLISGWVCAANSVEIRISNAQGRVATLTAAYGTTRADTVGSCDHDLPDTGFGMTFNFNHLPEGTYTIGAHADGLTNRRIGPERTFEVVHLVDFATIDDDRFLRGLAGECRVKDFPESTVETTLKWEQSVQNFVITEVVE